MAVADDFALANQAAEAMRARFPRAVEARYDRANRRVVIRLSSNVEVSFSPRDAQGLEHAKAAQLEDIKISPSGFAIHFPKLDADIYIPALLEGFLGSRRWMASRLGQVGGKSGSRAKSAASRANGRRGGRPRKNRPSVAG